MILVEREELAALIRVAVRPHCLFSDTSVPAEVAETVLAALPESEPVGWARDWVHENGGVARTWRLSRPDVETLDTDRFKALGPSFPVYRKPPP